jgi:multiple sugar transport system permease protein
MGVAQAVEKVAAPARAAAASRRAALRWEALQGYGFLLPALVLLLLFHLLPVFYAVFLSTFDARVFRDMWQPGPFIAAGNYARLLRNPEFGQSLANTLWFAGITVPAGLVLAVVFAQLLNARIWGRTAYRVTYFLPYVTSTVAAAVIWRWIFQPQSGVVNAVLNGLTTIPAELYEAARIDGASRWHLFRHITLPLLTPTLLFLLIVETIRSFQSFDFFYQMMAAIPVPGAKVVTIYLYQQGFKSFNLGYAAAIGIVLFVIIFSLTLIQFRATRSRVVYAD